MFRTMLFLVVVSAGFLPSFPAEAPPRTAGEWAGKPVLPHEGVRFECLFYGAADDAKNGISVHRAYHGA